MDGQMKDTKMSDSPSTGVAMRFNSQHQSDKLPDKVVQPWRCHDGRQNKQTFRQDLIKNKNKTKTKKPRHFRPVEIEPQFYSILT